MLRLAEHIPFDEGSSGHASTVLPLRDGDVLVAWFEGSFEGADDVRIRLARRTTAGWGPSTQVGDDEPVPHWNPVLASIGGDVVLFYRVGREIASWLGMAVRSRDGGRTWGRPEVLVPSDPVDRGPTRSRPLVLPSGRVLAPSSSEAGFWRAFVDVSDDDGGSWRRTDPICIDTVGSGTRNAAYAAIPVSKQSYAGRGVIQPTLWQAAGGEVRMLLRSSEGWVYESRSVDGGLTWDEARATGVPNNNSGIEACGLGGGRVVLACNPVGESWGARTPLTLLGSTDDGSTWKPLLDVETAPGEYSYPAMVCDADLLWLTYTDNRSGVAVRAYDAGAVRSALDRCLPRG